jgi:hypothetical protein
LTNGPRCAKCGAEYAPTASFCPKCGLETRTVLSGETQLTDSAAEQVADDTAQLLQNALGAGFTVGPLLGAGTFGMVFRARDVRLERDVAIKTMRREFLVSPEFVRRFEQEARALAALRHPNIVEVYDIGVSEQLVYLIMPLVKGETLSSYIRAHRPLSMAEAGRLVHGIAAGLSAAHKAGFVHRDVKPENVMIEGDDHRPLLMDFGIAKAFQSGKAGETRAGSIMGTPLYMSPEQATADPKIDHRSDIYSLGVLAYEVFTGVLPFQGETGQDLIHQHVLSPPPDPRKARPDLSPAASQAILRAMAKKPSERFQSADEFSSVLEGVVRGPGPSPRERVSSRAQSLIRIAALVALAAAAGLAARAGLAPAATASVAATVQVSELRFTLGSAQPIWGAVAQLERLAAANLDSVSAPAVGEWEGGVLYAPVIQLTARKDSADSATGTISLDPLVFPAGTQVYLSGGLSDTTFRLTLGDSLPVLPVSVDGPIQVIAGAPPAEVPFKLARIQLFPSSTGMDLELRPRQAGQTGLGPLTVSHVSFTKVDKIREGDQARDVLSSTLRGGTIQVKDGRASQSIASGSDVVLTDFAGTISKVALDTAGLSLALEGSVRGIPASLGGMPTRWRGWWSGKRMQTIVLALVWLGLLVWVVLPRKKRVS